MIVYGHIILKIPVLVRSLKSSNVEPSQYLNGSPPRNTGCCRHFRKCLSYYFTNNWPPPPSPTSILVTADNQQLLRFRFCTAGSTCTISDNQTFGVCPLPLWQAETVGTSTAFNITRWTDAPWMLWHHYFAGSSSSTTQNLRGLREWFLEVVL